MYSTYLGTKLTYIGTYVVRYSTYVCTYITVCSCITVDTYVLHKTTLVKKMMWLFILTVNKLVLRRYPIISTRYMFWG